MMKNSDRVQDSKEGFWDGTERKVDFCLCRGWVTIHRGRGPYKFYLGCRLENAQYLVTWISDRPPSTLSP